MGKGHVSKRQQLSQALAAAQKLRGGQQVVPREQRFVQELIQSRKQIQAWRTDMEATVAEARRLGMDDQAAVFTEHLAEVHAVEDRLTRVYVQTLAQDLKEPLFIRGAEAAVTGLEKDLREMQAEAKERDAARASSQPPVADAAADTEAPSEPAPAGSKLVLLPGQG